MKFVTMREHETVSLATGPSDGLTAEDMAVIDRTQQAVGKTVLSWCSKNSVKTSEYVGILAAKDLRLEILPKITGLEDGAIRGVLIRMLMVASKVPIFDGELTALDCQQRDLLEIIIGLLARRIQVQLRAGLCRAYQQRTDDLSRLRGKLDVHRQFTHLAATPQKLACRFDEFSANTPLNRLLLCALVALRKASSLPETQRVLLELTEYFGEVALLPTMEVLRTPLRLSRAESRWDKTEMLARLLLRSVHQTTHSGSSSGVSLIFDMNRLFESYVASLVRQASACHGFNFVAQGPVSCLVHGSAEKPLFATHPDIYLQRGEHVIVMDTKWKRLDYASESLGIEPGDAYQLYAYAQVYGTRSAVLIYPHNSASNSDHVDAIWKFSAGTSTLNLLTVDLGDETGFQSGLLALLASPSIAGVTGSA